MLCVVKDRCQNCGTPVGEGGRALYVCPRCDCPEPDRRYCPDCIDHKHKVAK